MAKNYMPEIAKMLGVEVGEIFKMTDYNSLYRFTEKGLEFKGTVGWCLSERIEWLLTGRTEILKLPWRPKKGEVYCRPTDGFEDVAFDNWGNHPIDFALKEAGMVFRTKEECEAALPNMRAKYLSETGADR